MQKLYLSVDENGMDTNGRIFIVAVVALGGDPQLISTQCEELERISGKGKPKWGKSHHQRRLNYLQRVFTSPDLRGRLCYAVFRGTQKYDDATIEAIGRAIRQVAPPEYKAVIYIDALSKSKRHTYGSLLRKTGISIGKVQGVTKDENNPLVRLADALAGFVRDALDNNTSEIAALFQQAKASGALVEV